MKVLHINASDKKGGAALAAWRLHLGLNKQGVHSTFLVQHKSSDDITVNKLTLSDNSETVLHAKIIQDVYAYRNRTEISNTHFSLPLQGIDLSSHPLVLDADIIHLHWVASFQTPKNINDLFSLNKPIVWTLHDFAPFTGGCHYPAGCENFKKECSACPQLRADVFNVTSRVLHDKKTLWSDKNFHLIAPSSWIASQVRESPLFSNSKITVIPNGVDTSIFQPYCRNSARAAVGIPSEGKYILCGAAQGNLKVKGFKQLNDVLNICLTDPIFQSLNVTILWVGGDKPDCFNPDLPFISLGRVDNEEQMALIYSAADIFVLPSLEDNLPNMMLESLSCGTPLLGFKVGGIPEVIQNGIHGYTLELKDNDSFAQAILAMLKEPILIENMKKKCRSHIEDNYDLSIIAEKHLLLYENLLNTFQATEKNSNNPFVEDKFNSVLPKLKLYCFAEEVRFLQEKLKDSEVNSRVQLEERSALINTLEKDCDDRLTLIKRLEKDCDDRLTLIERLDKDCNDRLKLINRLENDCDSKSQLINQFEKDCSERLTLINKLEEKCADRLLVINRLHNDCAKSSVLIKTLNAKLNKNNPIRQKITKFVLYLTTRFNLTRLISQIRKTLFL